VDVTEAVRVLMLVLAAVWYVVAASRVTRGVPSQPWKQSRTWCFLAGLVVTGFALVGPPGVYDDVFFYAP